MVAKSPLDSDPMDLIVNDIGDIMPPEETVFRRQSLQDVNRGLLELDHPMTTEASKPDGDLSEEDKAILRGVQTAKDLMETDETSEPVEPYNLDTRSIGGRQFICAIDPEGNIIAKQPASERGGNSAIYASVAKLADEKLARNK